jgi:hypothetical protein
MIGLSKLESLDDRCFGSRHHNCDIRAWCSTCAYPAGFIQRLLAPFINLRSLSLARFAFESRSIGLCIGQQAFRECPALGSNCIPCSVEALCVISFARYRSLSAFTFESGSHVYSPEHSHACVFANYIAFVSLLAFLTSTQWERGDCRYGSVAFNRHVRGGFSINSGSSE